jgi:hypothetical protein
MVTDVTLEHPRGVPSAKFPARFVEGYVERGLLVRDKKNLCAMHVGVGVSRVTMIPLAQRNLDMIGEGETEI